MILTEIGNQGQKMRGTFQRRLPEDPSKDYYYIQRLTPNTQALLIEYGFIDNPNDRVKLQNDLLNYVEGVVKAVANYAGVNYTPPGGSSVGENQYVVQRGDTLYSIARRFDTTVDELKRLNQLTSNNLSVGQVLTLPTINGGSTTQYIVQRGDSLWKISQQFHTTVEEIRRLNNLSTDVLQVGQVLLVPSSNDDSEVGEGILYTVQPGDTLWKIANYYNVTVNEIRALNHLTSDVLQVGQTLMIPSNSMAPGPVERTYTVQRGDSLWSIANQFGVSIDEIISFNNLSTTVLQPGQVLRIPH